MAKTKKKWIDFEITRVKLNPEQAVLSCCLQPTKGKEYGGYQCIVPTCGGSHSSPSS